MNKISVITPPKPRFRIQPEFPPNSPDDLGAKYYIESFEYLIDSIIQKELPEISAINLGKILEKHIPLVSTQMPSVIPGCISFAALCFGKHTQGVGRFIPDMLSKWLIPGTVLRIAGHRSLCFSFIDYSQKRFYLSEHLIVMEKSEHLAILEKQLPTAVEQVKLNILAVYHARHIISMQNLPFEKQSELIENNILQIAKSGFSDTNPYDHLQNFIVKLSAEKKLSEVEKNLNHLMSKRPKVFHKDIFSAVHNMLYLFKDNFTAKRNSRHISRIISFQFLFHRFIYHNLYQKPNKRYLYLKMLKTRIKPDDRMVLGILISVNFLHESERFERSHILEAIWLLMQNVKMVKDSYVVDRRDDKICSYYLEIEKTDHTAFNFDEIKLLKQRLPDEFLNRIENTLHPIFMPRNEEEVLKNIIILSKQLRFVRDLPQVIISYEKQTGTHICFNVILVRILKTDTRALSEMLSPPPVGLSFNIEEVKKIGYLKKKYPKESNLFKVYLKKDLFLRHDKSLDLLKARQTAVQELTALIGEFRDYNGGMIFKQTQALNELKSTFTNLSGKKEVLLENFFYSIRPVILQSIIPAALLHKLFEKILALSHAKTDESHFASYEDYYYGVAYVDNLAAKESIMNEIKKLKIPSFELAQFSLDHATGHLVGFIYRLSDLTIKASLEKIITFNKVSQLT